MTAQTLIHGAPRTFAKTLLARLPKGHKLGIEVEVVHTTTKRGIVSDERITFTGGKHGPHSIWASVSTAARMEAHFAGYVEANGLKLHEYAVNNRVVFPSSSSSSGTRVGRIVKVTETRVQVEFRYKNNPKRPVQTWVRKADVVSNLGNSKLWD